jgi:L-fuculose-phosphate aldolase
MHSIQKTCAAQIEEIVRASNRLSQTGFVTSQGGNLSMRVEENVVLITPTKVAKGAITFDDICAVDMQGNTLFAAPGRKPTSEWPFHIRVMQKRPDINAVVHAHPPVLTGFAIAGGDWLQRPFLPEPVIEVGPMVMVPYAMPGSDELACMFDDVIEKSNGFLMENHGALMVSSEGVWRAVEFLEMQENAAISIIVSKILGNPKTIPAPRVDELENVIKQREIPMPGLKGVVKTLSDIFVKE